MLLKALVEYAQARHILDNRAFSKRPIRWIIPLDENGNIIGPGLVETQGEKKRGREFSAPKTSLDKGVGGIAEFLADGITAVFGLESEPEKLQRLKLKQQKDRETNNGKKYEHFWRQIENAFAATAHPGLKAILAFRSRCRGSPTFLRWGKKIGDSDVKPKWWAKSATGEEVGLGPDQFTFQVNDLLLLDEDRIKQYWRDQFDKELSDKDSSSVRGLCLVTGQQNVPIALTHTVKIRNLPNTQSFGAAIVSFDKPAFGSYGFDQSHNAPISTKTASAYCHALNALLENENNSVYLGGSALCFWAKENSEAGTFFAKMLNHPDPRAVAEFIKAPWAGVDRNLANKEAFYSVTLAGNGGRVVVKHWMQQTVESARGNFEKWFKDLEIRAIRALSHDSDRKKTKKEGKETMPALAIFRLACTTVKDAKDIQSDVASQLYRAALEGTAPSISLLKPILSEFYSALATDSREKRRYPYNESRFALLRRFSALKL